MLHAIDSKGKKISAKPDLIAYCPECHKLMIPKCGKRKIWHWSHIRTTKHKDRIKSLFDF